MLKNLAALIARWISALVALVKGLVAAQARGLLITLAVWAAVFVGVFLLIVWLIHYVFGGWMLAALGVGAGAFAIAVARAR